LIGLAFSIDPGYGPVRNFWITAVLYYTGQGVNLGWLYATGRLSITAAFCHEFGSALVARHSLFWCCPFVGLCEKEELGEEVWWEKLMKHLTFYWCRSFDSNHYDENEHFTVAICLGGCRMGNTPRN
jgi:hypothetical protein